MPQYGPAIECARCHKTVWSDNQRFTVVQPGNATAHVPAQYVTVCRKCARAIVKQAALSQ